MAPTNLEQGIIAIQQQDMATGKRLLKIALKNDTLNAPQRVQALLWLAETDTNPQFKVEQYQKAIQIDPTNQDVMHRLSYWTQQLNQQGQGNTPSQGMRSVNPKQNNQDWQQQQPPQQNTTFNMTQGFTQGMTPSQGMQPVNPKQNNQDWQQQQPPQQNTTFNNQGFNQGMTPSQGMQPVNPKQNNQDWQQQQPPQQNTTFNNQGFNQGMTPSQGMQPARQQGFNAQQAGYGQQAQIHLNQVQRSVGVLGGPNKPGTGFFVSPDGLIATTRHVVSGERTMMIELLDSRQVEGQVVRAFPELDLVLIQSPIKLDHLMAVLQAPVIPDNMPITAVTHAGQARRSTKRRTMSQIPPHWIPTIINNVDDAGGSPIFDGNNMLIGMLTNNAKRSNGYYYGLHIDKIYQCVNLYVHEKGQLEGRNTIYCIACGIISQAPTFSGYFCENCGKIHPYAIDMTRHPQPNLSQLYGETSPRPCPDCGSQAGFYERECLRCGYEL